MRTEERTRHAPKYGIEPDLRAVMDSVVDNAKGWLRAQRDRAVLTAGERAGRLAGKVTVVIVVAICVISAFMMGSIALALWLGELMQANALGFLAVGGAYLLLAVLFNLVWGKALRERITLAIINAFHAEE